MSSGHTAPPRPAGAKKWVPAALAGLAAVVAGLIAPGFFGDLMPPPSAGTRAAAKGEPLAYTPPAYPEAPDPRAMLLRLALGTGFVLVLAVTTIWLGRRWLKQGPAADAPASRLGVVETLPLGNRCAVHLVRVGRQQVLVGVDATGLRSLVALPDLFEETLTHAEADTPPTPAERQAA